MLNVLSPRLKVAIAIRNTAWRGTCRSMVKLFINKITLSSIAFAHQFIRGTELQRMTYKYPTRISCKDYFAR